MKTWSRRTTIVSTIRRNSWNNCLPYSNLILKYLEIRSSFLYFYSNSFPIRRIIYPRDERGRESFKSRLHVQEKSREWHALIDRASRITNQPPRVLVHNAFVEQAVVSVDVSMSQPDIGRTNRELSQGVPRRRRFFDVGEQTANSKRANFNLTFNFIYIYKAKVGRRHTEARNAWKINTGARNLHYVRDVV